MIRNTCERESSVAASARSGQWPTDLRDHLAACAACTETKCLAEIFLQHATVTSARTEPPAASIVWQRMQAQRQQLALKRATQSVTLMSVFAGLYAVVLAAWYLPRLWHMQPSQLSASFGMLFGAMVVPGILAAVIAVLLGACSLVLLGGRTDLEFHT